MDSVEEEECSAVDVSQRIKEFQTRINKISTKDKSRSRDSNNNSECENRNIVKTRSKSLPGKSPIVRYEEDEMRNSGETPAPLTHTAVGNISDGEEQEEIVILPSVKMLATRFSHQSRTRRIDSKVF